MPEFGNVWSFTFGDYEKIKPGKVEVFVDQSPTYRAVHNNASLVFQTRIFRVSRGHTTPYYTVGLYCVTEDVTVTDLDTSFSFRLTGLGGLAIKSGELKIKNSKLYRFCMPYATQGIKELDTFCRLNIGRKVKLAVRFNLGEDKFDVYTLFVVNGIRPIALTSLEKTHPSTARQLQIMNCIEASDFTLSTDDGVIPVHSQVLTAASPYFATIFAERNSTLKENDNGRMHIPDCKRALLEVINKYLYLGYLELPQITALVDYNVLLGLAKQFDLGKEVLNSIELALIRFAAKSAEDSKWPVLSECLDLAVLHEMDVLEDVVMCALLESNTEQEKLMKEAHGSRLLNFALEKARCLRDIKDFFN